MLTHVDDRASTPGIENMRTDAMRLPGPYVAPLGAIWLAQSSAGSIGCVALRPISDGTAEVKRMYVDRAWRGKGVGRALLETLIAHARTLGYHRLRLGTLSDMSAARSLYQSLGFEPIERYRADEMVDTEFYELELR